MARKTASAGGEYLPSKEEIQEALAKWGLLDPSRAPHSERGRPRAETVEGDVHCMIGVESVVITPGGTLTFRGNVIWANGEFLTPPGIEDSGEFTVNRPIQLPKDEHLFWAIKGITHSSFQRQPIWELEFPERWNRDRTSRFFIILIDNEPYSLQHKATGGFLLNTRMDFPGGPYITLFPDQDGKDGVLQNAGKTARLSRDNGTIHLDCLIQGEEKRGEHHFSRLAIANHELAQVHCNFSRARFHTLEQFDALSPGERRATGTHYRAYLDNLRTRFQIPQPSSYPIAEEMHPRIDPPLQKQPGRGERIGQGIVQLLHKHPRISAALLVAFGAAGAIGIEHGVPAAYRAATAEDPQQNSYAHIDGIAIMFPAKLSPLCNAPLTRADNVDPFKKVPFDAVARLMGVDKPSDPSKPIGSALIFPIKKGKVDLNSEPGVIFLSEEKWHSIGYSFIVGMQHSGEVHRLMQVYMPLPDAIFQEFAKQSTLDERAKDRIRKAIERFINAHDPNQRAIHDAFERFLEGYSIDPSSLIGKTPGKASRKGPGMAL